jgi:hypothetical protein
VGVGFVKLALGHLSSGVTLATVVPFLDTVNAWDKFLYVVMLTL